MSESAVSKNSNFDEFFPPVEKIAISQQDKKVVVDKRFKILKFVVVLLAILLLMEGIIYSFIIPCFGQVSIVVSGVDSASKKNITEKLAPLNSASWLTFDTEKAVSLLSSVSYIESVSVDKKVFDRIYVSVKERVPVAKTILSVNGTSKSVQIDENCVLFTSQSDSIAEDNSIPLISGIPVENLQEGMRLPGKYRVLLEQISAIRKLPQKYFAAISEIQVVPKEYGNYELILYPIAQAKVKVITDRLLTEDALKYMMVVLDVVNSIEPDVVEIDLRYDSLSYKCR